MVDQRPSPPSPSTCPTKSGRPSPGSLSALRSSAALRSWVASRSPGVGFTSWRRKPLVSSWPARGGCASIKLRRPRLPHASASLGQPQPASASWAALSFDRPYRARFRHTQEALRTREAVTSGRIPQCGGARQACVFVCACARCVHDVCMSSAWYLYWRGHGICMVCAWCAQVGAAVQHRALRRGSLHP